MQPAKPWPTWELVIVNCALVLEIYVGLENFPHRHELSVDAQTATELLQVVSAEVQSTNLAEIQG